MGQKRNITIRWTYFVILFITYSSPLYQTNKKGHIFSASGWNFAYSTDFENQNKLLNVCLALSKWVDQPKQLAEDIVSAGTFCCCPALTQNNHKLQSHKTSTSHIKLDNSTISLKLLFRKQDYWMFGGKFWHRKTL